MQNLEEIIAACIRQDQKAQRELYELISRRVIAICRRYVSSRYEADDIFQEAFINIYRGLKTFDPEKGEFKFWIHRITVNAALKHIKKYHSVHFTDVTETSEERLDTVSLDESLSASDLLKVIDELPASKKLVFNLYAIEGYSHKEIAEMLNISEGTSKSQLAKAKAILIKLHEEYYEVGKKELY